MPHKIVITGTAAMGAPYYEQDEIRTESPEEVMALENATINVWKGHPGFVEIPTEADPRIKYERLHEALLRFIGAPK